MPFGQAPDAKVIPFPLRGEGEEFERDPFGPPPLAVAVEPAPERVHEPVPEASRAPEQAGAHGASHAGAREDWHEQFFAEGDSGMFPEQALEPSTQALGEPLTPDVEDEIRLPRRSAAQNARRKRMFAIVAAVLGFLSFVSVAAVLVQSRHGAEDELGAALPVPLEVSPVVPRAATVAPAAQPPPIVPPPPEEPVEPSEPAEPEAKPPPPTEPARAEPAPPVVQPAPAPAPAPPRSEPVAERRPAPAPRPRPRDDEPAPRRPGPAEPAPPPPVRPPTAAFPIE
jgi:hypothetical protein